MKNFFRDTLSLEESIYATLSWFSIMERPLDIKEIKMYLWRNTAKEYEILEILNKMLLKKTVGCKSYKNKNYYYIKSDEDVFDLYFSRLSHQKHLFEKAKKVSYLLRFIPFIKKIYICNSLALGKASKQSDIDFFVVSDRGMMFFSRVLITTVLSTLGLRRHDNNVKGYICLSFFTESNNINLEDLAIKNDIYLIYWIATAKLLIGNKFLFVLKEQNKWIHSYLPNLVYKEDEPIFKIPFFISWIFKFAIEAFLRITFIAKILNKVTGIFQKFIANKKIKALEESTLNIVSDNMLKFHNIDRREEYREVWIEKTSKY